MNARYDVAVVGAGIAGLAHAWRASERGLKVVLLEQSAAAEGASVRNFGMLWPIGQPAGERYEIALESRELWLRLSASEVVHVEPCGSLHLAHHDDELAVLEEFCGQGTHQAQMLTADEVVDRSRWANPANLRGGMFSTTELRVDPRVASRRIATWLSDCHGVSCHFNTLVTRIDHGQVKASDGRSWQADRVIVCGGSDLQTLYPDVLERSGLQRCKLQMLRTTAQPQATSCQPHIASGLTLRHYAAFEVCPSLADVRLRIENEAPELNEFGIHVMASQLSNGEVILGDSHEYGNDISPFDNTRIDDLMLRELRKVIALDDWTIQARWHGIYAKNPHGPFFEFDMHDGVHLFTGMGGAGMTMSFGLVERSWKRWSGE